MINDNKTFSILVVDDESKNLQLLANLLTEQNFEVELVNSGEKVFKLPALTKFDLILLDVMMPAMNGFEVCKKLKEVSETREIPIIFLSAKGEKEDLVKGFEFGAVDYLTKPFNYIELLARVKTHLRLKYSIEELKIANAEAEKAKEMAEQAKDEAEQAKNEAEQAKNEAEQAKNEAEKAKNEAEKAKHMAESANHAKSEFLANMSHEIRTSLNAVIGFGELLTSIVSDKKQKSYLDSIKSAGNSLLTLINDILDLSKIEAGKIELLYSPVDINKMFSEIEQIFNLKMKQKNLQWIIDINDNLPSALMLDETRLRQVLLNLVGNAVKFTEKGYIKLFTLKKLKSNDETKIDLTISIEDSGIGIPEQEQQTVFAAFQQQAGQDISKFGGTGLGLSISKGLIEMMNGQITVKSVVGQGTTFEIALNDIEVISKELPVIKQESFDIANICFESGKILVVDDVEASRKLLTELLMKVNLKVLTAENGQEAALIAEEHQPDIILMDIRMPLMDGIEATELLKQNPKTKKIPVIIISASSSPQDLTKLSVIGVDSYFPKPVNINRLLAKLSKYFNYTVKNDEEKDKLGRAAMDESGNSNQKPHIEDLPPETLARLPELIDKLENQFMAKWAHFQNKQPMKEVKNFASDIKELGEHYRVEAIIEFAGNLITFTENYDVDKLVVCLNEFPELIKILKLVEVNR